MIIYGICIYLFVLIELYSYYYDENLLLCFDKNLFEYESSIC